MTIFREHPTGFLPFLGSIKDQWPARLHLKLQLDGKPLLDMHAEEFVSFKIPVGRHLIEFIKVTGGSAQFELHEGERVFIRPGVGGSALRPIALMTVVPCDLAVQIGGSSQPMPVKYLIRSDPVAEEHFPTRCENKYTGTPEQAHN